MPKDTHLATLFGGDADSMRKSVKPFIRKFEEEYSCRPLTDTEIMQLNAMMSPEKITHEDFRIFLEASMRVEGKDK